MTEVNKNRAKTDEAWERLYARLDKDRLLVEAGQGRAVRRKLLLNCLLYTSPSPRDRG